MRDKLIELLKQKICPGPCIVCKCYDAELKRPREYCAAESRADHLLSNGVIVPPCKVGDKVYRISTRAHTKIRYIQETTISRIAIDKDVIWLFCACNPIAKCVFGKTVFLTREEAEQELKGEHHAEIH